MTKRALSLEITGVTLVTLAVAWFWALDPILIAIFMMTSGQSDAERIRQIWHFRLIQPEWISGPDQFIRWQQAEAGARLALVLVAWLASVVTLVMRYRRGTSSHLTRRCSEPLAAPRSSF